MTSLVQPSLVLEHQHQVHPVVLMASVLERRREVYGRTGA